MRSGNIAFLLLIFFGFVFTHSIAPHTHEKSNQNHHNSDLSAHSLFSHLVDLLDDLSHAEIGDNHLEEYIASSQQAFTTAQAELRVLYSVEFSDGTITNSTDTISPITLASPPPKSGHLTSLSRRGPPFHS